MRILVMVAALFATTITPVSASVAYNWQGTCIDRTYFESGLPNIDLGCSVAARGQFIMPDSYTPGTAYNSEGFGGAVFRIFDEVFVGGSASYVLGTSSFTLPELDGVVTGTLTNSAMNSSFGSGGLSGGLRFSTELRIGIGGTTGFVLHARDVTATLIPEPATLALALLPVLYLGRLSAIRSSSANKVT